MDSTISVLLINKYKDEIINKDLSIFDVNIISVVTDIKDSKKNNKSKNIILKEAIFSPYSLLGIYKGDKEIEINKKYIFSGNLSTYNNNIYFFINNIKEIE